MATIRWGMIGCGAVAEVKSGPGFYKANNSQLVAVTSADPAMTKSFAERHGDTPQRLKDLSQSGQHEDLYRLAHDLKGEGGNLGLTDIYATADQLCKDLKAGSTENAVALSDNLAAACITVLPLLKALT